MTILQIDSSINGENSASRDLTDSIVDQLAGRQPGREVVDRDLVANPLPHLTLDAFADTRVLDEFLAADTVVIGAPMYNFTLPSQLKAWIDRIAVAGKTFRYTANGPEGLAGGKRVIVALARGGFYDEGPARARASRNLFARAVQFHRHRARIRVRRRPRHQPRTARSLAETGAGPGLPARRLTRPLSVPANASSAGTQATPALRTPRGAGTLNPKFGEFTWLASLPFSPTRANCRGQKSSTARLRLPAGTDRRHFHLVRRQQAGGPGWHDRLHCVGRPAAAAAGVRRRAAVEMVGGWALVLGYRTRLVALTLAVFSILAALSFHSGAIRPEPVHPFLQEIAMAGGLLQVVAFGGGRFQHVTSGAGSYRD